MELFNGVLSRFWAKQTNEWSPWSQEDCEGVRAAARYFLALDEEPTYFSSTGLQTAVTSSEVLASA
jgi:hypothetical protein